ncbi:MAG TPA: thioredoxin domain-containing protein, partial [Pseudonocardia sp.]
MPSNKASRRNQSVVAGKSGPSMAMIIGIVVVVLFAGAVGYGIYHTHNQVTAASAPPPNATATGIPIGNSDAPATVDIYLDFQCPVCRAYETTVGPTIDSLIADGSAKVIYHP